MSPRQHIEIALDLQNGGAPTLAVPEYQKAIEACDPDRDGFEYLYAHYELMRIYALPDSGEEEQAASYARKCLDILQPSIEAGAIGHFMEQGQFYEEVIRWATNCIAWHIHESASDPEQWEEALRLISFGAQYAEHSDHFYVLDTQARLLLKLNRQEEAYRIVRSCLKEDRSCSHFDDIAETAGYKQWKADFESGAGVVLDEDDRQLLAKAEQITAQIKSRLEKVAGRSGEPEERYAEKAIISSREVIEQYGAPDYFPIEGEQYLLFKGDLEINGPLNREWIVNQTRDLSADAFVMGMVVDGNLTVNGDLLDDNYVHLYVKGNLHCHYLFSYNGQQHIGGNADIRLGAYGEYNDGQLSVNGDIRSPYLIIDDHAMPTEAMGEFIHIGAGNGTYRDDLAVGKEPGQSWGWGWTYLEDSQKLLVPQVWDEHDCFSVEQFFDIVRRGDNPFIKL